MSKLEADTMKKTLCRFWTRVWPKQHLDTMAGGDNTTEQTLPKNGETTERAGIANTDRANITRDDNTYINT